MATKKTDNLKKDQAEIKKEKGATTKNKTVEAKEKVIQIEEEKKTLKKRELPTSEKETKEASPLKKRALPGEEKDQASADIFQKKTIDDEIVKEEKKETKEKSALEKMRERVSAQKKLDQNMMTQQSLKTQTPDILRAKLATASKDDSLELVDKEEIETPKITIGSSDFSELKTVTLETQNNKLKKDLEKAKQQLAALLSLEFDSLKVLDANSLTLSNEFVEAVSDALAIMKEKNEGQEQSLKDELQALQKEISTLKSKNNEAKKASEDAQKAASQAQKAINQAKKAIEEQESNETRDFKAEIRQLEKDLQAAKKLHDEQLAQAELTFNNLKNSLEKEAASLKTIIQEKEEALKEIKDSYQELKFLLVKEQEKNLEINEELFIKTNQNLSLEQQINNLFSDIQQKDEKYVALEQQLELLNQASQKQTNDEMEKALGEQAQKIDEIIFEYQRQISEKEEDISRLQKELLEYVEQEKALPTSEEYQVLQQTITSLEEKYQKEKENVRLLTEKMQELENSKLENVVSFEQDYIQKQVDQYQALLVSERNSHLQVEQKLCSDLNSYKEEIEKLQTQIVQLKSDSNIQRLNQQIETIEQFVSELKNNGQAPVNRDIYNSHYEEMIKTFKKEQVDLLNEIERRNKILTTLRDEKLEIIKILKTSGKNPELIEKQVKDINAILKEKVEKQFIATKKNIEAEILSSVTDDLVKYCDKIRAEAQDKMVALEEKYAKANNVSSLLSIYNQDCEEMAGTYSNELSRLNLELELNRGDNTQNIEEKVLFNEKQYRALIKERDLKFNEAMTKLTSLKTNESQELNLQDNQEMNSEYFAFVGEEFVISMAKYEQLKKELEVKLETIKLEYENSKKVLLEDERVCLQDIYLIKEKIVTLNSLSKQTDEVKQEKEALLSKIEAFEIKLDNIRRYGLEQLEVSYNNDFKAIQEQYMKIQEDENTLRKLYAEREREALARLKTEKDKVDHDDAFFVQQNISEYIYVEEETERVLESILEKRTRNQEFTPTNSFEIIEENQEITENPLPEKEEVVDTTFKDQKVSHLHELETSLQEYQQQLEELKVLEKRYLDSERQLTNDFKDIRKFKDFYAKYKSGEIELKTLEEETRKLDPISQRRILKSKNAELKSLQSEITYCLKKMGNLQTNQQVSEYQKLINEIGEIAKTIEKYQQKISDLKIEIVSIEQEIASL